MSYLMDSAARLDPQRASDLDLTDANIRAIHAASEDVDAMEADRRARTECLMDEFRTAIDRGDAWQTVFFAGKKTIRVNGLPTVERVEMYRNLGDVLYEALDIGDGGHEVIQYVLDRASEGDEKAQRLLEARARAWVAAQ